MPRKNAEKRGGFLEPDFKNVLVCKSKEARPYLEIFIQEPENVFQQNLGTLFGIFEINDDSEDSSYVVNYLISIIKKEYFSQSKRGPIESFEAALHKANLALAKLAEHENVSWIGNFNAISAVIEKNNIHLTQTGTTRAFLLRAKTLVDLGEGEGASEVLNPLKTFQEVVSGRLENQDKLILTTESLFNIFSFEEIKRSALKFSKDEFIQFLNTALINELERAAVLVIDIEEKEGEGEDHPVYSKKHEINAFSQETFARKFKKGGYLDQQEERKELVSELKKDLEKSQGGLIDEKTGHIYIKDDGYSPDKSSPAVNYLSEFYEKISDLFKDLAHNIKGKAKNKLSSISVSLSERKENLPEESDLTDFNENIFEKTASFEKPVLKKSIREKLLPKGKKIARLLYMAAFYVKSFVINRFFIPLKKILAWAVLKYKSRKKVNKKISPPDDYASRLDAMAPSRQEKKEWFRQLSGVYPNVTMHPKDIKDIPLFQKESRIKDKLFPSFSRIKNIFAGFGNKKKVYALIIVILLIIIPYFFTKIPNRQPKKPEIPVETPKVAIPLENDKAVTRLENLNPVITGENIVKPVNVNGKIFAIEKDRIISAEDNKNYPFSDEFKNPDLAFEMDDLNLILIMKDKKILSFSASARKFAPNNISIPADSSVLSGHSFLTYAYILDGKNNQIYRYPRAEGGFGDKTNWLKDTADFSSAKDMAINENIYVTDGRKILKFLKGRQQEFTLEESATPINADKLYTKPDSQNLYVLDKNNSRVIKLGPDGNIIAQFYNPVILNATDFSVNEENQTVYISDGQSIQSFSENI